MSVYVIAQLEIEDEERYVRYARAVPPTLRPFGGEVVAADSAPRLLEGTHAPQRVVLLRFPSRSAMQGWADSPEYRRIVGDRHASTTATVVAVHAL